MGKRGKKTNNNSSRHRNYHNTPTDEEEYDEGILENPINLEDADSEEEVEDVEEEENGETDTDPSLDTPSKFNLYQQSVQSPKGDISYLQKFFLMYVGGRMPLHFQEDFCGTALLSTEWLRSDSRRTAIGLDFDLEALEYCMENNITKLGSDGYSRISLFHGNVLNPLDSKLVKSQPQNLIKNITLKDTEEDSEASACESVKQIMKRNYSLPARDIVCAFNYSCCCLHKRVELVSYFKHVIDALSKKGGIFVMDLYGGTSSECELKLQRKFPNFTYVWEQEEFDIIQRKTRISLHFHLRNPQKKIRRAFSYSWRLFDFSGKGNTEAMKEELEEKRRTQVVAKLHAILRPFLLRRLKIDVEQMLPRKKEIILYASMTEHQRSFQDHLVNKTLASYLGERAVPAKMNLKSTLVIVEKFHKSILSVIEIQSNLLALHVFFIHAQHVPQGQ